MPPKTSSPSKTRTLNSFFGKSVPATTPEVTPVPAPAPLVPASAPSNGSLDDSTAQKATTETTVATPPLAADSTTLSVPADPAKETTQSPGKAPKTAAAKAAAKAAAAAAAATAAVAAAAAVATATATVGGDGTSSTNTTSTTTTGSTTTHVSKVNKVDTASMFKVRSGKASITESKLKFSSHPSAVADLCKFHEYRDRLREAEDLSLYPGTRLDGDHVEITSIPEDHYGLMAKLVEESEVLLSEMATSLIPMLCPLGFDAFGDFSGAVESQETGGDDMDVDGDGEVNPDHHHDPTGGERPASSLSSSSVVKRSGTTVSIAAIAEAVQAVAQRVNYGIPVSSLPDIVTVTPPNLSVYRWEVQDIDRYFPADMKAAVIKRRNKRMEASAGLTAWFLGLDTKQREDLCPTPPPAPVKPNDLGVLGGGGGAESTTQTTGKKSRQPIGGGVESMDIDGVVGGVGSQHAGGTGAAATVEATLDPVILESKIKEAEAKKKEVEAKEERRLEKGRKMAEKQLEKDMKEAERQQKEEVKRRKAEEERLKREQTSMRFVGFFKPSTKKDGSQVSAKNDAAAPSFSELFHPFYVKKSTTLAPINRFAKDVTGDEMDKALKIRTDRDGSAEEEENCDMELDSVIPSIDSSTATLVLSDLFKKTRRHEDPAVLQRKEKLPKHSRFMTVQEVIQSGLLVQEEGDDTNYVLSWKDIPSLRMRLVQFAENYRPAYYGTWSKRSKCITGRRFLSKDTDLIEYDFDSEAEWEEDEEGEECKSDDDEEDPDDVGSDQDEEDDWLVPEGYLSEDEGLDAGDEPKPKLEKKSKESRRPTLAHMTPTIIGPVFEITLGECSSHPALEPYHIEFLGDYGIGMDMFHAVDLASVQ
ncbi:Chromatin assembly factor 1, subunit A [Mortierella sp. GBA43]|nr:Chromatin assembly factor 1, subunit A [Mortierella sp. GBA43]